MISSLRYFYKQPTRLLLLWLGLLLCLARPTTAQSYNPNGTSVAGGNDRGSAANQLFNPLGIYVDPTGNLYVTDTYNQRIQKWVPGATSGTTVAGSNGIGDAANQFNFPKGVWVDAAGNVYVADYGNYRIQKFALGSSQGVTVAGGNGQGTAANQFYFADDIAVDAAGNIYVADSQNHRVQKWVPGASSGTTVASGPEALGIYLDAAGNIYVADGGSSRILKFAPGSSQGVIVAGGNGRGSAANQLANPVSVWVDPAGNIYVADQLNNRIQKWAPGATSGTTVAGGNGTGSAANQLTQPNDVAVDAAGNIYASDPFNNRVQRFSLLPTLTGLSASPNPVCVGSPVSFTTTVGNVTGTYNYTITNGAGSAKQGTTTGTVFSQSLTAASTGSQSFTLTVTNGGNVATATTSLLVTAQSPDYQPLADLYNNTGGPTWASKTGWLSGCSPCGWYGVTCDGSGRVTGLNLNNNNLSGTLPASLSALTALQSLELGANALSGGIPSAIASLTALQTLNLSRTQLGGTIPQSLGQLTQLQNLLLNQSELTGSLPASLGNLTQLQNLQLYSNQLSGCFPGNYTSLCGRSQISFANNTNLPGGGDFGAFCSNGTGSELVVSQYPQSGTACVGSAFSFSVVARGAASYQWYREGQRLAESGPVLSLTSVSANDGGTYQVYINYSCRPGAVQSDYFTLTARSDGNCASGPDLTPILSLPQGNFAPSGPESVHNLTMTIAEQVGKPTAGTIVLTLTPPLGYSLGFDPTLTSINVTGGTTNPVAVNNAIWEVRAGNSLQLTLVSKTGQGIAARGVSVIGLSLIRTSVASAGTANLTVNVNDDPTGQYDANPANNIYARILNAL